MTNALLQLIQQGGILIAVLMCVSVLLWTCIIERFCYFYTQFPALKKRFSLFIHATQHYSQWQQQSLKKMFLSQCQQQLMQYQPLIRNLIALCPLLGLLGTVTGMITVFDTIAITGNSDAKLMAAGIFHATLPTMAGLMLALSALYVSHQLTSKTNALLLELHNDSEIHNT